MLRITAYADRLIDDLDLLDWTDAIKNQQRNWIGRSTGARISFPTPAGPLEVFTTRPDTVFGATYMVVAPEHPLVADLTADEWPAGIPASWTGGEATPTAAVAAYQKAASQRSEIDRQAADKGKTGVFTGAYAVNPVTGERIPVFVADYVLMGYGTGAIMAVPGQDQRDWDFAEAFDLPIVRTVSPTEGFDGKAFTGEGPAVNSGFLDGLEVGRGQGGDHRLAGRPRPRHRHRPVQAAGLAVQPPALLGRAVPHRLRRRRRGTGAARGRAAAGAAADGGLHAHDLRRRGLRPRAPAGSGRGLDHGRARPGRRRGRPDLPPRAEHDAQLGRLVLVRAALPGPHQRRALRRPRERALLDGSRGPEAGRRRRPVRRRRRARRAAPAVRPLLAQGPLRPGPRQLPGAVPPPVQPGDDPGPRLPRRPGLPRPGRRRRRRRRHATPTRARRSPARSARWASR